MSSSLYDSATFSVNNPLKTNFIEARPVMDGPATSGYSTTRENVELDANDKLLPESGALANLVFFLHQYEESRKRPIWQKANEAWNLYHSEYFVDPDKDDWMSKKKFPFFFMAVERLAAALSGLLEDNPKWFEVTSLLPQNQIYTNMARELLAFWLQHDAVDFGQKFRQILKSGLVTGHMHMLVVFEANGVPLLKETDPIDDGQSGSDEDDTGGSNAWSWFAENPDPGTQDQYPFLPNPDMPRLRLENLDSQLMWLDTGGREDYKIWHTHMMAGDMMDQASVRGWDEQACRDAIIRGPIKQTYDTLESRRRGILPDRERQISMVKLTHFEGNLYDRSTGELVFKKRYMIVANDTAVIQAPIPIPHWDQESSVQSAPLCEVPNAPYGKSPLAENVDNFGTKHDMLNMQLDYFQQNLYGMVEVDQDMIDPEDKADSDKVYPGKVWKVRRNGTPGKVIQPIASSDVPDGFWQFLQYWSGQYAEATGLTQEVMGIKQSRIRTTGMETEQRASESGKLMDFIFQGVESKFLAPLLRKAFLRILQYTPDAMWTAWVKSSKAKIIPAGMEQQNPQMYQQWASSIDEAAGWDARTRYKKLGAVFQFRVKIFTSQAQRQAEIEKATFLLQTLAKLPNGLQTVRMDVIVRNIVRAFGWDPEEILNPQFLSQPNPQADNQQQGNTQGGMSDASSRNGFPPTPDLLNGSQTPMLSNVLGGNSDPQQQAIRDNMKYGGSPFVDSGAPRNPGPSMPGMPGG